MAQKEAKNLKDLLKIREHNRQQIDAINQNLGSALGFKYTNGQQTNHPAIIIFVPDKVNEDLVSPSQVVPKKLEKPDENGDTIYCFTDVNYRILFISEQVNSGFIWQTLSLKF